MNDEHQNLLSKQYLKQLVKEGAPLSQDRKNEQNKSASRQREPNKWLDKL